MRTTSILKIFIGLAACVLMLATPATVSHAGPGYLVTIRAYCAYTVTRTHQHLLSYDEATIVVTSDPRNGRPVYVAQGYDRSNHLADGWLVRAFVRTDEGVKLVDGIQLFDGSVWVNGVAYARADSLK